MLLPLLLLLLLLRPLLQPLIPLYRQSLVSRDDVDAPRFELVKLNNFGSVHCGCEGRFLSGNPCRSQSRRNRMTLVVVCFLLFAASSSQPHAGVSFQLPFQWPRATGELSIEDVFRQAAVLHAPYMTQPAQASLAHQ